MLSSDYLKNHNQNQKNLEIGRYTHFKKGLKAKVPKLKANERKNRKLSSEYAKVGQLPVARWKLLLILLVLALIILYLSNGMFQNLFTP